jgi:hypothetical protein
MVWGRLVKGGRVPKPKVKALSAIFKGAQKPYVDPGKQHAWIVQQCSKELESIPVGVYGIHDLLSPPDKGQRVLIGAAFYSLYDLETP